jgi:hypothetical protein
MPTADGADMDDPSRNTKRNSCVCHSVEFIDENWRRPGVRRKKRQQKKKT